MVIPPEHVCFLMRVRKGMNLGGRKGRGGTGSNGGGDGNQGRLCEKMFSIKGKREKEKKITKLAVQVQ